MCMCPCLAVSPIFSLTVAIVFLQRRTIHLASVERSFQTLRSRFCHATSQESSQHFWRSQLSKHGPDLRRCPDHRLDLPGAKREARRERPADRLDDFDASLRLARRLRGTAFLAKNLMEGTGMGRCLDHGGCPCAMQDMGALLIFGGMSDVARSQVSIFRELSKYIRYHGRFLASAVTADLLVNE